MRTVIVPNQLRDEIVRRLDAALPPEASDTDRDALYHQVLAYYDEHGVIPDFTITKSEDASHD